MSDQNPVPHLTTALSGPLHHIESVLLENQPAIEAWFRQHWQQTPAPLYASVDLRNAGFKLAPVDTNLFPAGFNNLNPAFHPLAIHALQSALERVCPYAKRIVLVAENHTRNRFYLQSIATLRTLIEQAGYNIHVIMLAEPNGGEVELFEGTLQLEPFERSDDELRVSGKRPCAVLLNNDLSAGRPEILENLAQQIIPPLELGWSGRLKSEHFGVYREVVKEFTQTFDIDPWLIDPLFRNCGEVNFMNRQGEDCLAHNVEALLLDIQRKYDHYGIDREPFVVIKADAGTYGMGIMTATSPADVQDLNRKQRTRMSSRKEGGEVTGVIIQEGVYTAEDWEGAVAEPVVYMIDHFVVGGFYRVHTGRGVNENLNAPGMHFEPLAFAEPGNVPDRAQAPDAEPNRFYAYGVISRLALLAAAREISVHETAAHKEAH